MGNVAEAACSSGYRKHIKNDDESEELGNRAEIFGLTTVLTTQM